jgi:NhaA family Na+:H+ antiporter
MSQSKPTIVRYVQEYSLPLIAGVAVALCFANCAPSLYQQLVFGSVPDLLSSASHGNDHAQAASEHSMWCLHFLINDIFMVLFFGLAAKEITESCLPGGALNPLSKAINPLLATLGGVLGPVGIFLLLNLLFGNAEWTRGWGIPTATDIALAWLGARWLFGAGHPAVSFLLLLAVADDAIGLGIIAIAYPDPLHPTEWLYALWIAPGMGLAYLLRRCQIKAWWPYVLFAGSLCWFGLFSAHLHPALSLVFVVPFMPGPRRDLGLYIDEAATTNHVEECTLFNFEHDLKLFVDFGLFFFAFANAGVPFSGITSLTWILLVALVCGKMLGITLFSLISERMGCRLPSGMNWRHLVVASSVAGVGLTVALFVSGQAFTDSAVQGAAKMGALFSIFGMAAAFVLAKTLGIRAPSATAPLPGTIQYESWPPVVVGIEDAADGEWQDVEELVHS